MLVTESGGDESLKNKAKDANYNLVKKENSILSK